MKNRADRLVSIAEDALERERRVLAEKMNARDQAEADVAMCIKAREEARKERDRDVAAGAHEVAFAELDAWIKSHDGRVVRAERALALAITHVEAAQQLVAKAHMRTEQMRKLRDRSLEAARIKEVKAERRAEDERLAPRATEK